MSFPTTLWGNTYDIYTAIPGPTSSSPGSSDGPVLGNYALLADGSAVQFVQFAATTAANKALIASTAYSNYLVTPSTAANQLVIGVNDLTSTTVGTGASVTQNYCAWIKRKGAAFPLVKGSAAADHIVCSGTTSGALAQFVPGTDSQGTIVNLVVVGGSDAVSPCLMT